MAEWGVSKQEKIQLELDRQKRVNASKEAKAKRAKKKKFWEKAQEGE